MIVTAQQGESLDALLWRLFNRASPLVEAVLAANRGLASIAHSLPQGHAVTVPDELVRPGPAPVRPTVNLWD